MVTVGYMRAGLSVSELAARAGVPVRTIRFYQSEGLLPRPEQHGREVRYQPAHVERLGLIASLQERGLRLAAIRDLFANGPDRAHVAEWLGLGGTLLRPWTDDVPVTLTRHEIDKRLEGLPATALADLERTGLIERDTEGAPTSYRVPSAELLDIAVSLLHAGIDVDTAAGLRELLEQHLGRTARALVERFTADVSLDRLAREGPESLANLLEELRPLARRTVDVLFAREMERALREVVEFGTSTLKPKGDQ